MGFTLLFVCTGNTCRSPIAERLAATRLAPAELLGFTIGSAGTRARPGFPVEDQAARVIRKAGADPDGFRTRLLGAGHVEHADLVLTATRRHRAAVADLHPAAARRTFTLPEFAAIVAALPPGAVEGAAPAGRAHALVAAAQRQRGRIPPLPEQAYDIADPIGGGRKAFALAFAAIERSLAAPLAVILGERPERPGCQVAAVGAGSLS